MTYCLDHALSTAAAATLAEIQAMANTHGTPARSRWGRWATWPSTAAEWRC